jgi:predicted TIM-barrel fold metal-dependent hydrolase
MFSLRRRHFILLAVTSLLAAAEAAHAQQRNAPKHFVFFGRDRERIADTAFVNNPDLAGAQLKYTWRELEPERDRYDFSLVLNDIAFLKKHGKRLFIQFQDVSFSEESRFAPAYLLNDPTFSGGVARKYESDSESDVDARFDGMVIRRWDAAVLDRFAKLMTALGRAVDGRIEGIALSETAVSFGKSGQLYPLGFSFAQYVAGVKSMMSATRLAFPRSHVIVYGNFMPGNDTQSGISNLRAIYDHANQIGVGVGGPDILPYRPFQRLNSLPLIAARNPAIIAGLAVQDGNLAERKRNGERISAADLYRFAADTLRLNYMFWGTEEPYYSADVIPFLRSMRAPKAPAARPPIIDMHLHAELLAEFGGGGPVCSNEGSIVLGGWNPRVPLTLDQLGKCSVTVASSATDEAVMRETIALLERYNIRGVTAGPLELVTRWHAAAPDRIIPALAFTDREHSPVEYRRLFAEKRFAVFGEITAQYRGRLLTDSMYDAYFALAEELDIPVAVHLGEGPPGGAHLLGGGGPPSNYRVALGSPLQLEAILIKHPRLRVYVMHFASPFVDEMIAMLYSHPQLYVDIAQNNWGFPRAHFYSQLKRLIDAGFEERILFGSDQMVWPKTIEVAIRTIESAPFLSEKQKRDIMYNNAARFLRFTEAEIARDHGRR